MIITTPDNRDIDISIELYEILAIGRFYRDGSVLSNGDSKMLHRVGWGLVSLGGADLALGLINDLVDDRLINPAFESHLREKWTTIAEAFE